MSTETFAPFPFAPTMPPAQVEPAPAKKKKSGSKKPKAVAQPVMPMTQTVAEQPPKPPRKRKAATDKKRAPKFELQTILAATAGLKEADMALFGKMLNLLTDENKSARTRLLASLGKVFA